MGNEKKIKVVVKGDKESLALLGPTVNRILEEMQWPEDDRANVEVCVLEAAANCFHHSYQNNPQEEIQAEISGGPTEVEIRMVDHGVPMDPRMLERKMPDPPSPDQPASEHGRGLCIIRGIMTDVSYESAPGHNVLIMKKMR